MKNFFKSLLYLTVVSLIMFSCGKDDDIFIEDMKNSSSTIIKATGNLPGHAEQGVMLHAHIWPFKAIEKAIPDIAAAGFNSVQVSPIQKTKGMTPWWIVYQPCNLKIGNMVLGSDSDFRSLCATAESHGVKIIVDAVLNHVGDNGSSGNWANELDPALKNSSYFHNKGSIGSYQDRWQVTQQDLLGLPDWNTQSSTVQQLHKDFLNLCISAGADGFRFDAAKHIETSGGEDGNWSGQYWESVLGGLNNKSSLYLVGEVLPDRADNHGMYLRYFDITAHGYGGTIRSAVRNHDVTNIMSINHGSSTLDPNKAMVYVENHDDFENDQDGAPQLSYWQRKMGFAIITARAAVTPRLFDRPGNEDLWKDAGVAVINHFHNAMEGQNEYLRFPRKETLVVDRGSKGTAIINLGGGFNINTKTNLSNGTYSGDAGTFNVSGGNLSGNIPEGAIIALYDGKSYGTSGGGGGGGGGGSATTTVYAKYNAGWGNELFIRGDTPPLSWDNGIKMTNVSADTWMWQTNDIPKDQKFECKVLINNNQWATNNNWWVYGVQSIDIFPNF